MSVSFAGTLRAAKETASTCDKGTAKIRGIGLQALAPSGTINAGSLGLHPSG